MRSFSKKLAFVLAAAMVFTAFAPAAKAEAAAMKINKSSKILYVTDGEGINDAAQVGGGKGNVAEYDFSVSNKPKDYKKTLTFEWSSSDEDVIEVGKAGLTKAVGVGVADVICVVTEKATGKATTLKSEVTVKANAAEVVITNADDYADLAYEVGAEIDLNRAMYDANGTKAPKRGVVVTDYTRWMVEPSAGVKVTQSNGKYVFTDAAEAGTYKLWCETYQSSKYQKATAKSDVIEVELVKEKTVEIAQTAKNKFTVTYDAAVASVAASDIVVTKLIAGANGNTPANQLVKSASLNNDKTVATVELYNDFVNGVQYEITVKGYDMETITASVGDPASIVLTSSKYGISNEVVADGNANEIYARLYDANGIDVTPTAEGNQKLSFKITYTTGGYTYDGSTGKTLYFTNAGDYAVVEATYHSGKYDNQGNEVGKVVSNPFTFVGVNKSYVSVVGISKFGLGGEYAGTTIKMDDKGTGKELGVKFKLADGNDSSYITAGNEILDKNSNTLNIGNLVFKSLNTDVLEVVGSQVYPYKTGTAQVMAYAEKNGQQTALAAVTIEVLNYASLSTISFSNNRVVVSTGATANITDPLITVNAKDQYGKGFPNNEIEKFNASSDAAKAALQAGALTIVDGTKIDVDVEVLKAVKANYANNASAMTFNFEVVCQNKYYTPNKVTGSFIVELRNATGAETYDIEATGLVETNVARRVTKNDGNENTENMKTVTFNLYKMKNAAKIDTQAIELAPVSMSDVETGVFYYKLTRNNNKITADAADLAQGKVTVNFTSKDASNVVNSKNAAGSEDRGAGVYELTIYKGTAAGKWSVVASERVTTTFDAGSYSLVGRRAVEANSAGNDDLVKCFGFKNKEGAEMSTSNIGFNDSIARTWSVATNANASGVNTIFVESVSFFEELPNGDKVEYKVNVNQSVKIKTN